jgi:Zn-dependent M28 family amino/carboxypeptidase
MKQWIGCLLLTVATLGCSQGNSTGTATTKSDSEPQSPNQQQSTQGAPQPARLRVSIDGAKAMQYTKEATDMGPRWVGNAAHKKLEAYLRAHLKNDGLVEDTFVANTPAGKLPMRNFIAKFSGTKPGVIVVSGHYDTIYNRKDFVGANDAGSSTGLLVALADALRADSKGKPRDGYSVWLVWFDGEEAVRTWTADDSVWGSRHLAEKWNADGTAKQIKALINVDMIGDADLHVLFDTNSNGELQKVIYQAARSQAVADHFYQQTTGMDDDHIPFAKIGVPVADLIDFDYGPNNSYWHTPEDTVDKLSPKSLEIVGNVVLGTIELLDKQ